MPAWECLPAELQVAQQATSSWKSGFHLIVFLHLLNLVWILLTAMRAQSLSGAQLFVTPWTVTLRALLSMGCSRQEHWSDFGISFFLQGTFLTRDQTHVSCISCSGRWILYHCATWNLNLMQSPSYMANIGFFFCLASALSENIWRKIGMDTEQSNPWYAHNWKSL